MAELVSGYAPRLVISRNPLVNSNGSIHILCSVLSDDSKFLPQVSITCHNTHVTVIIANAMLPPRRAFVPSPGIIFNPLRNLPAKLSRYDC